jgi:hypothetical protein
MNYPGVKSDPTREMVCVTVEIRERAVLQRVRITARNIERALAMAGEGRPDRKVSLVLPLDAEGFPIRKTGRTPEGPSSDAVFAEAA